MYAEDKILIGCNENMDVFALPKMSNRHGVIAGATGTGKTVTLKVIAETLSAAGIPSITMDIKGDLSGCARIGEMNENISKRVEKLNLKEFEIKEFPVRFFDIYKENGHPIRFKIDTIGPEILSLMLAYK